MTGYIALQMNVVVDFPWRFLFQNWRLLNYAVKQVASFSFLSETSACLWKKAIKKKLGHSASGEGIVKNLLRKR